MQSGFDPSGTFIHITDGGTASPVEVTETFWQELMTGHRPDLNEGWLMLVLRMRADTPTWEMHPAGDEILYLLSGAIDIVLEEDAGERLIKLGAGEACIVPRGRWHRQIVHEESNLLGITFGKGTEIRPVKNKEAITQ